MRVVCGACLCALYVFACFACDVVCVVVGCVFVVFVWVGVLLICLIDAFIMYSIVRCRASCTWVFVVVCACACSMCLHAVIVDSCVVMHAGLCVVVLIRCLMRSRVVCGVVWLYVLLVAFVILFLCVPCLCVNVMVVIWVCF